MILLIDNYDSFSYNLYQMVGAIDPQVRVIRNDELTVEEILASRPDRILLSPGPGRPEHAGVCREVVRLCAGSIPILGVCLGHQAICQEFGARIGYAEELMHGKQSEIQVDTGSRIFQGLPEQILAARYHSLLAVRETLPDCLEILAETADHQVMAVKHRDTETYGLQFHPESILTPDGKKMLQNFLKP